MKLRVQFTILMVIFCLIFLSIGFSAYYTGQQVTKINKQVQVADDVVKGAYQLSYLSNDYLFHIGETRQNLQWQSKFTALSNDIDRLTAQSPEEQALVNQIKDNRQRLKEVYSQSVATITQAQETNPEQPVNPELVQVAWSRFIVQNQGMIFDASLLSKMLKNDSDRLENVNSTIIFILLGTFLVILITFYFFFNRRIFGSISTLQEGTRIIGSGDLDYAIGKTSDDEIGSLSEDFNRMTTSLKAVTASKSELEREIARREKAQMRQRESELRFKELFDTVSSGVAIYEVRNDGLSGSDYIIQDFNNVALSLEGKQKEEVIGQSLKDLRPTIDDFGLIPIFREVWKTGFPAHYPETIYVDGKFANYYENHVFRLPGGEIVVVYDDVTEREKAEEANRLFSAKLHNAMEIGNLAWWEMDCETGSVYCDDKKALMLGFLPEHFTHYSDFTNLLHPDDYGPVMQAMRDHLEGKTPRYDLEYRIKTAGGNYLWFRDVGGVSQSGPGGKPLMVTGIVMDITSRKQTEVVLRESEERFRLSFENASIGMSLTAVDGQMIKVNRAFCEMLGYTEYELETKGFIEVTYPEDLAESQECFRSMLAGERQTCRMQKRYIQHNGSIVWADVSTILLHDPMGEPLNFVTHIVDITDRKRAESLIRETNEILNQAQTLAHVGSWQFDLVKKSIVWSDETYRIFGCKPGKINLSLENIRKMVHPDDLEKHDRTIADAIVTGHYQPEEYRLIRPDGTIRTISGDGKIISDTSGKFVKLVGAIQDITERRHAEDALRESEARFRQLFENSRAVMLLIDPEHGAILDANTAAADFYGYRRDVLCAMGIEEINQLPVDDVAKFRKHAISMESNYFIFPHRLANGTIRTVEVHSSPIKISGRSYLFSIVHDITDRKRAEEQREALIEELEQKNTELERFTYTVSHDLKSPLITIGGYLGFLEKDAIAGDIPRLQEDIERITSATEKMRVLLSDLLSLSRVGRIVNPPERVSFGTIAHEAVEQVGGAAREHHVTITIVPDLPEVYIDHTRIREVLVNLLENAIKFSGEQDNSEIEIGARYDLQGPAFFVKDNGIGIDPKFHEQIFDLFKKLDANAEGTGIGLAIVKRIIEVHGGRIWVESAGLGKGSTFFFTLPESGSGA